MSESIEEIKAELERLEERVKEGESSIFRALRTLVVDLASYQKGERKEFPKAALMGLVFAYLRPRLLVTIAGLSAVALAGVQVWLLLNQNRLLAQQNAFIESQTSSNRIEAISTIVSGLDAESEDSARFAVAQLSTYQNEGFDVLIEVSKYDSSLGRFSTQALASGVEGHTRDQALAVVDLLFDRWYKNIGDAYTLEGRQASIQHVFQTYESGGFAADGAYESIKELIDQSMVSASMLVEYLESYEKLHGVHLMPSNNQVVLSRLHDFYSAYGKLASIQAELMVFANEFGLRSYPLDLLDEHFSKWCEHDGSLWEAMQSGKPLDTSEESFLYSDGNCARLAPQD